MIDLNERRVNAVNIGTLRCRLEGSPSSVGSLDRLRVGFRRERVIRGAGEFHRASFRGIPAGAPVFRFQEY